MRGRKVGKQALKNTARPTATTPPLLTGDAVGLQPKATKEAPTQLAEEQPQRRRTNPPAARQEETDRERNGWTRTRETRTASQHKDPQSLVAPEGDFPFLFTDLLTASNDFFKDVNC